VHEDKKKNSIIEKYIAMITNKKKLSNTKIKNLFDKKVAYIKQQYDAGNDIDKNILHSSDITAIPTKGWQVRG
jgi:hypothetical protein